MNQINRQARSKARAKTMRIQRWTKSKAPSKPTKLGVPFTVSKWGYMSQWKPPMSALPGVRMTHRSLQSWQKRVRFDFRKTNGEPMVRLTSDRQ